MNTTQPKYDSINAKKIIFSNVVAITYVANILIAINPYEQISGLYDIDMIRKYKGQSLGSLPPHIFAIADKAYRDMMRNHQSQSIIISGESGAGKTESQKHIIRFLCESWGHLVGTIEQRILEIVIRKSNISDQQTFVANDKGIIVGGFVSHYLLERSRLCGQNACERNYHIFYQLIAGADDQMASKLKLDKLENFNYLNKGCLQFFLNKENSDKVMRERKNET
ncbi:myosin head [Onchocerca flexuosa]|uniref:Myosin head n=1 Tax=Onchocerca flexuosa TaxID=387005 RepID=A0A238BQ38_9BILA|nr:myosin head [Onchocerca flexuosa]